MTEFTVGLFLLGLAFIVLWIPAWWLAGRIDQDNIQSLVRLPVSLGLMLVGYITSVNLLGKLFENSTYAAIIHLALNLAACVYLLCNDRKALSISHLRDKRKLLLSAVLIALFLALPQWFQAVSGNRWDEGASSSIHITAPNQFAEGVFPPRHNAFPDITIKYHYGFTILSGTVHWLTGFSSNVSIDVVSTMLWLLSFLIVFFWLLEMGMSKIATIWGSFAMFLGGGLSWLYLPRLEVYRDFQKHPPPDWLVHSYDPESSWLSNLITINRNQNVHLRNADGDLFALPFDIAIHYQQHAVALGITLTIVAAYLFWLWQRRSGFAPLLMVCSIIAFGLIFLGHAVFGGIASISAGLLLGALWLTNPGRIRLVQGIVFTLGVTIIAFLHGGMMSIGDEYGPGTVLRLRDSFGYMSGSPVDIAHWLLAGFGLPLVVCGLSVGVWFRYRHKFSLQHNLFFAFFGIFGLVSYLIPQLFFFGHGTSIEEQTEVSKFFFCTHLAIALISVIGINYLGTRFKWWMLSPVFLMSAVTPLAVSYAAAHEHKPGSEWQGFYKSPYDWHRGINLKSMGEALGRLKHSNRDTYYDFSSTERSKGALSELLIFSGSIFTLSPTRYEITGTGYLISEDLVRDRILLESRVGRLLPGSLEKSETNWLYSSPGRDMANRPVIVRSRFNKMVATGTVAKKYEKGQFGLYRVEQTSENLDQDIDRYWSPKVISQANADWNGDGKNDLVFFDHQNNSVLVGEQNIPLPHSQGAKAKSEFPLLSLARFKGDSKTGLILGRMADSLYVRGETVSDMVRQYPFHWQRWNPGLQTWNSSYKYWFWNSPIDIPIIADHDSDGYDSQFAYRSTSGHWTLYPRQILDGPTLPKENSPLPVIGRFLPGSHANLALWSPITGEFRMQNTPDKKIFSVDWGGRPHDVLLPGDYDGDGYDELGLWQPHSNSWWVKVMPSGPELHFTFGSSTGIPLPFDYDDDGRLDLAYWEPGDQKIYVSFDFGKSIGKTVDVPAHSIPIFVHMY